MSLFSRSLPLSIALAIYAAGTAMAGVGTLLALQHFGAMMLGSPDVSPGGRTERQGGGDGERTRPPGQVTQYQAEMTPNNDRWRVRPAFGPSFGGSSRSYLQPPRAYRDPWGFGDESDDDFGAAAGPTFRTVCVRLCDGYYFPVSFAVTPDRLKSDSNVCRSRCGAQARLFIYRNPGGAIEDMEDLSGRPYRQLPTAFRYRTEYVSTCKCQPDPWEEASRDRHRVYALAVEARKGNKDAAKELQALRAKLPQTAEASEAPASLPRDPEAARRLEDERMGLGGRSERAAPRGVSVPDWFRRAFGGW
jgi:hypothetical protein